MNRIVTEEKVLQLKNHILFTKLDFICDAPTLDRNVVEEIKVLSVAYMEGIYNVVNLYFKNDWVNFAAWLGFQPEQIDAICKFSRFSAQSTYMRVDIAGTTGEPRMVELNAGPNVGGLGYSVAHRICHPESNTDPLHQWAKWVNQRIQGQFIDQKQYIAIVEDACAMEQMAPIATLMADELKDSGIEAQVVSHRDLLLKEQGLFVGGHQITHLYCLFDLMDVVNAPEEYQPLYQALENQQVFLPVGFEGRLIGSKLCMMLVHDARFRYCFDESLFAKLQAFIPFTWRLEAEKIPSLFEQRVDWIVKPAHGSGGNGILCGWEVGQDEWQVQLNAILESGFPYVIQRRVTIPQYTVTAFSVAQQEEYSMQGKCLLGIYVMNNILGGGYWRVSRIGESDIINTSQGAIAGNVILLGDDI